MLQKIRKSKLTKCIAVFCALNLLVDIFNPMAAFALTGGPSQPEVQSFEPIGTSEMVNMFTGDFTYNIPLMDVGGYPINMSYNSGITMDQEASWVGLGWNINPGAITRNLRGLPDDFDGDIVEKEFNIKDDETYTATAGVNLEIFGGDATSKLGLGIGFSLGISYNSYNGVGISTGVNPSLRLGQSGSSHMTVGMGISSSDDGLAVSPSVSLSSKENKENQSASVGMGASYSSRGGLKALTMNYSISEYDDDNKNKKMDGNESRGSIGGGSSISMGGSTYVPSISMPMHNQSYSASVRVGGLSLFGTEGSASISGTYSKNGLKSNSESLGAYGYNNNEDAQNLTKSMMDFNREKDLPYSRRVPALALTNLTYDMYNIAGQGIAGTFRPFRNDVGYVYDSQVTNESNSGSLGVEIGTGSTLHGGVDFNMHDVNSKSGKWASYNKAANTLSFTGSGAEDYEPYYFKQTGEKNVESDPTYHNDIHGDAPVRIDIESAGGFISKTTGGYASQNSYTDDLGAIDAVSRKRQRRALSISKLTKGEAIDVGLDKNLYTSDATNHHNAEFSVTKTDGSRYVYGVPLYNTTQKEVTFNASGNSANCVTGLVDYTPGDDNSTGNSNGKDNYFSSTTMPKYAHSYMLSAVLSADYVDVTGDGPSDDDLGSYTLFEYSSPIDYNWRTPYETNKAYYSEGYRSLAGNDGDDKGSYIYGVKEIKYLDKITTKTHVAKFITSARIDGYEAANEDGGLGTSSTHKLDEIKLYSKPDYDKNPTLAVPIKTVHFEYDYSLCPYVPNNDKTQNGVGQINEKEGKLTLKEVYFTYQNSNKGMLNPYKFYYESGASNPSYDIKGYDRWGNYKANATVCNAVTLNNSEFPYVDQTSKTTADNNAKAWCMNKISLPSGGDIEVTYEADDYAYVQDRKAYQMFVVKAITKDNQVYSANEEELYKGGKRVKIYFDVPSGTTKANIFDKYISDIMYRDNGFMYFNFLTDIKRASSFDEFVKGYFQLGTNQDDVEDYYGIDPDGVHGWVKAQLIDGDHPVAKAAWQFGRLNIPRVVYNQPPTSNGILNGIIGLAKAGATMMQQVVEMFEGADGYFRNKDYGSQVKLEKSWIRLMNPDGRKYGGGVRVKKIAMNDAWDNMSSETKSDYGQQYFYDSTGDGEGTSTGVAAYEPQLGGDENSLKHPIFYGGPAKTLAPDDEHYVETPFGESFYPSPVVGYSKVTVQNIVRANVGRHATGKTVHEFYTAKDFPTKASRTILEAIPQKSNPISQALAFDVKDYMTVSQGYVVELNDMHGKPKSQAVYAEGKTEKLSSISYHYLHSGNELDNNVTVINADGTLEIKEVGVEYDMVADFREHETESTAAGAAINLELFLVAALPIAIPPIWPSFSSSKTRFRSAVNTKVVARYGILEKTVATDLGSTIETKNLAYDTESGEVLVTETINDYNDPIYNFTYPAHWRYDRMGPAYKNIELSISTNVTYNASLNTAEAVANNGALNIADYLVPGDELLIGEFRYWVWDDNLTDSKVYIIKRNGDAYNSTVTGLTVKVIRSGRRNLQSTPIGTIASLRNPLKDNLGNTYKNTATPTPQDAVLYASNTATISPDDWEIINASSIEFNEKWKTNFGDNGECTPALGSTVNPYILGIRGNWRAKKSHLFLGAREQRDNAPTDNNLDIRHDGIFATYAPFWIPNLTNNIWDISPTASTDWTWASEVTDYSPFGFELENKDALGRYSSAIYGYGNALPLLVANNSERQNICFDGFEDYAFKDNSSVQYACDTEGGASVYCYCLSDHFDFFDMVATPSLEEAHSGNRSLKVLASNSVINARKLSATSPTVGVDNVPYTLKSDDQLKIFSPITYGYSGNKKYLVSYWVKEAVSINIEENNDLTTYTTNSVDIRVSGSYVTKSNIKKSDIIDGWQKVEYEFNIPASTSGTINVKLIAGLNNAYFDDIRIQPIESSMKSYVYDEVSLRLMAQLDENNYATFYEYDEEGALTRIKKETARGIVTIQESKNSKYKQ